MRAAPDANLDIAFVDRKAIDELLTTFGSHKTGLVMETIDIFVSESGEYVRALKTTAQEQNLEKMHRLAHTLKSTTASVGAINLSSRCKALDTEIRTILSSANPVFPAGWFDADIHQISEAFILVCQELEKVRAEVSAATETN
jgi:HPt (histidine-containing phosphotransfer) domain-containing protein